MITILKSIISNDLKQHNFQNSSHELDANKLKNKCLSSIMTSKIIRIEPRCTLAPSLQRHIQ